MNNVDKIRQLCEKVGIAEGKQTDEFLFTLDMVDLFYYKNNIGEVNIKYGFTDGANDGGIDSIYNDQETMYLVQGKSTKNLSIEDIKNVFSKIADTVYNFEENNYDKYSSTLKSKYLEAYDSIDEDKNISFVLFTNTTLSDSVRSQINDLANSDKYLSYTITVYDANDIVEKRAVLFQESDLIENDKIDIYQDQDHPKNHLFYGDNGLIVNVKASSLKKLFDKYSTKGLFSYNLREFVSQKSVDDGIDSTIKKEKDNFWYYNNGITIGCNDFDLDGNNIKLYDFSIINGAQTTTKIGKSKLVNEKNDFAVVCKIIKSEKNVDKDREFISKISEASNSQKPIRQRDLKANFTEQKTLQHGCASNKKPLAVEIKRGVKPKNYKKVDKWQRVTNEYIGQLVYACIFQKPGTARSGKSTIFTSNKVYNSVYKRKHDYNTLYDLVRLGDIYDTYEIDSVVKTTDIDKMGIVKNAKLCVLAIACYLVKKGKNIVDSCNSSKLDDDNLSGFLITDYIGDDLDEKVMQLYDFIVRQLIRLYKENSQIMKITSYSNFFKTDKVYVETILKSFDDLDEYDTEKLNDFMSVFFSKKDID